MAAGRRACARLGLVRSLRGRGCQGPAHVDDGHGPSGHVSTRLGSPYPASTAQARFSRRRSDLWLRFVHRRRAAAGHDPAGHTPPLVPNDALPQTAGRPPADRSGAISRRDGRRPLHLAVVYRSDHDVCGLRPGFAAGAHPDGTSAQPGETHRLCTGCNQRSVFGTPAMDLREMGGVLPADLCGNGLASHAVRRRPVRRGCRFDRVLVHGDSPLRTAELSFPRPFCQSPVLERFFRHVEIWGRVGYSPGLAGRVENRHRWGEPPQPTLLADGRHGRIPQPIVSDVSRTESAGL